MCRNHLTEVLGKSAVEDRWGEGLRSYHRFDPTKVPLNQKAYDFWAKQGFTSDIGAFTPGCQMSNAQMGWLAMIGYRHVWTGPIIFHVHSHIHIYVGPAGGRMLSVYPRRPLRGQRLPPARLLRRPRGHHPKKMVPEPGRRSKPERVWGLEILIFGASRQPGKPGHIGILFMLCAECTEMPSYLGHWLLSSPAHCVTGGGNPTAPPWDFARGSNGTRR